METLSEDRAIELVKAALASQTIKLIGPANTSVAGEYALADAKYLLTLVNALTGKVSPPEATSSRR